MGGVGFGKETSDDRMGVADLRASARAPGSGIAGDEAAGPLALTVDAAAIVVLGAVAGAFYQAVAFDQLGEPPSFIAIACVVAAVFCVTTRLLSTNNLLSISRDTGRARMALTAWVITFTALMVVAFALKIGAVFSRGAVFTFFIAGVPVVAATRVYIPRLLAATLTANSDRGREVIIAAPRGSGDLAQLSRALRARGCAGVHVIEFDSRCDVAAWPGERQQLMRRLLETARISGAGEVYVLASSVPQPRLASIMGGLRLVPRSVFVIPDEGASSLLGLPLRRVGPSVAVETQKAPLSSFARRVKRSIDFAVASVALGLLAPAFAAIALAIKLDSNGPVFFRQRRNGFRGLPFRIVKFRTMRVLEDGDAVAQAQRDDKRVTRVGRWLRKTSLDELPQLLNVLWGEMSLVGPRPHALAHDEFYARLIEDYELRQHVKPGLTGWAQVNGLRGETPTVDVMLRRIEFDLWYASHCSILLDFEIVLRTVFTVLRQDNAY